MPRENKRENSRHAHQYNHCAGCFEDNEKIMIIESEKKKNVPPLQ